ncbi:MAG TPA: ABC transporter permease [Clostridia bacterium]|nr:ABC transporter permease [Clostridia bacterium]
MGKDLWKRLRQSQYTGTCLALLIMAVLQTLSLGFHQGSFGAWWNNWFGNWINILRGNAFVGMIALGMTFVIITGGIDLAVGSTLVAVGAVVMTLLDTGAGSPLSLARYGITGIPAIVMAIAAGLAVGGGIGSLIGLAVTKGRVPPFIVTLGAMYILRSVTQYFTQSYAPKLPLAFTRISNAMIGGQRILPIVYWFVLAGMMYVLSKHTRFGRHIFAVGSNERATRLSGISVDWVKFRVYGLMGLVIAVASIAQIARYNGMDYASSGNGYELDAIAAVVVGGTSMSGGRGSIVGTVLGMLIIGVMNNLLILMGVDSFLSNAFKGAIVIAAVLLQHKEREA